MSQDISHALHLRLRFKNVTVTADWIPHLYRNRFSIQRTKTGENHRSFIASERCFQAHRAPELDHGIFMASIGNSWKHHWKWWILSLFLSIYDPTLCIETKTVKWWVQLFTEQSPVIIQLSSPNITGNHRPTITATKKKSYWVMNISCLSAPSQAGPMIFQELVFCNCHFGTNTCRNTGVKTMQSCSINCINVTWLPPEGPTSMVVTLENFSVQCPGWILPHPSFRTPETFAVRKGGFHWLRLNNRWLLLEPWKDRCVSLSAHSSIMTGHNKLADNYCEATRVLAAQSAPHQTKNQVALTGVVKRPTVPEDRNQPPIGESVFTIHASRCG